MAFRDKDLNNFEASDIQIGAVEIKNGTTDQRAIVDGSGSLYVKEQTVGQDVSANSKPVVIASDQSDLKVLSIGTELGNGQVTVDTTVGGVTIVAASGDRKGVLIKNQGTVDCYIGTGTVTTANGVLLEAGESVPMPTDSEIKGITAGSSTTIGYFSYA